MNVARPLSVPESEARGAMALLQGTVSLAPLVCVILQQPSARDDIHVFRGVVLVTTAAVLFLCFTACRLAFRNLWIGQLCVWAGVLVWYVSPAFFDLVVHDRPHDRVVYDVVSAHDIWAALLLLAMFLPCFLLAWRISRALSEARADMTVPRRASARRMLVGGCVALLIGVLPYLLYGNGVRETLGLILDGRGTNKPWLQATNLGDERSPIANLGTFAMIAAGTVLWCCAIDGRLTRKGRALAAALATLCTSLVFFDQGTRAMLVLMCVPAVGAALLRRQACGRKVPWLRMGVALVLAMLLLQVQLLYRETWTRRTLWADLFNNWLTLGDSIDQFKETVFAAGLVPSRHPHFHESILVQFLTSPVPRALWPGKPVSGVARLFTLERWNMDILTQAGNTFPGVLGQFYMSWGYAGAPLLGLTFGALAGIVDGRIRKMAGNAERRYALAVVVMLCTWLFLSFRVLAPGPAYPVLFAAVLAGFAVSRGGLRGGELISISSAGS